MRYRTMCAIVLGSLPAVACDSPAEPPEVATMELNRLLPGAATAGSTVSPSIRLLDSEGQPVDGAEVTFEVTGGGGSIGTPSATTNPSGIAVAGGWTLGPDLVPNTLLVRHGALPPLSITVWGCSTFCIDVRFVEPPVGTVLNAFILARQRWEEVIVGNLPPVQFNVPADPCKDSSGNVVVSTPALNEVIDDLVVYVQVDSIDGVGQVLGSAGPCYIRNTSKLPVFGIMRFDEADLLELDRRNILEDVILHELGHVLGLPAMWTDSMFLLLQGEGTNDPYYTGAKAASQFELAGGTLINGEGVPVENTGGSGTRDSHWRESVMSSELMTGFISGPGNPLSAITIGAMEDLGYQVDYAAADAYTLPGAGVMSLLRSGPQVELLERPLAPPRIMH